MTTKATTPSGKCARLLKAMPIDALAVLVVYLLALNFRFWGTVAGWTPWTTDFVLFLGIAVAAYLTFNSLFGVYGIITRSMSLGPALRVGAAAFTAAVMLGLVVIVWPTFGGHQSYLVPRSVVAGGGAATIAVLIGWRFVPRIVEHLRLRLRKRGKRVLVVGAGQGAEGLLREIARSSSGDIRVVGLVDDNPRLYGMHLLGHRVLGSVEEVPRIVQRRAADEIIIAIPSATADQMARIHQLCKPAGVPIKMLPSLRDLLTGRVTMSQTRPLDVKDLLGRPVITTDLKDLAAHFRGATVVVTGAAGSIGSELCRQLARYEPACLLLVDQDESGLFELCEELRVASFHHAQPYPLSILQEQRLEQLFAKHKPTHAFHAAAYKHVPLMEATPDQAIVNNIWGTYLVARTAARQGVQRFVNISTDKAVEPVSVMGASKWAGELLVALLAKQHSQTRFASVRFGNVLGSRGSVLPLFKRQIESGGPVTVTHPDMTRYFMLIEEAVQLVLQAAVLADEPAPQDKHDPHTFLLDMGQPVSILEVARRMVEFYSDGRNGPVDIVFTGLRPGERLAERLTWPFEELVATSHPRLKRIYWSDYGVCHFDQGTSFLERVEVLVQRAREHPPREELIALMAASIPGYQPKLAESLA